MIKLPEDISPGDVHQWLNGGVVYVDTGREGKVVCEYRGHYDDDPRRLDFFRYDTMDNLVASPRNVYVHWPHCGAVNYQAFALFLVRQQSRQYRRTYNSRQVTLYIPRKWEAMKLYGSEVGELTPSSGGVVLQAFNPTYVSFGEALQQLQSQEAFSRAINPYIILVAAGDTVLVYYKQIYAAYINESGKLIPVNADAQTLRRLLKHFEGRVTL